MKVNASMSVYAALYTATVYKESVPFLQKHNCRLGSSPYKVMCISIQLSMVLC